jgi:CrcB protein
VALGGRPGAVLRYTIGESFVSRVAGPLPFATFVINVSGCFILGIFLTLVAERDHFSPFVRLAVAVGFVGAYTTFSTFGYETVRLAGERASMIALLYFILSVIVGYVAVVAGIASARLVTR